MRSADAFDTDAFSNEYSKLCSFEFKRSIVRYSFGSPLWPSAFASAGGSDGSSSPPPPPPPAADAILIAITPSTAAGTPHEISVCAK